jgi:divalent metal cation (Fe/Co/Zn/Cd) transporter
VSEISLPTIAAPAARRSAQAPPGPSAQWLAAARRAKQLSWLSLVWMSFEGGIAIAAGIIAGSVALIGFGIDSAIEGAASLVIIWRFTGARMVSHAAEDRAQKLVAFQFFLLAPYVTFEAVQALVNAEHPEVSTLGMVLTASSLIGMPLLGIAKQRVAKQLGSQATHGEGTQNLLCAYLAAAVLIGLAGNALFGAWWLDPVAALVIAGVALREGLETWRGEGCCAAGPNLDPTSSCHDDCCEPRVAEVTNAR